jgi:Flp pilus assembly CpaF family ATPase
MTIRKFPPDAMTFDVLEREKRSVDSAVRQMCESLVLARKSIVVAGGTGSGETSLLNALSRVIPEHERIVTIEDARELRIQQENWVALETVEPYEEGAQPGPYSSPTGGPHAPSRHSADLLANAYRQRSPLRSNPIWSLRR